MASWVSHLIVADQVLKRISDLRRREFCVGNIAPDCNVENADWTAFTPPRRVTHWMTGEQKQAEDCERFFDEYISKKKITNPEEESFLWGYYAHLVTDAEFQRMIRDETRVKTMWKRVNGHPELKSKAVGMPETFDSVKLLIDKEDRLKDLYALEREYLDTNPNSGYLTEIVGLECFPDYLDFFPKGAIVRKIKVMGNIPDHKVGRYPYVCISRDEYKAYLTGTAEMVTKAIMKHRSAMHQGIWG